MDVEPLVKFKSHLYYEEKDQVTDAEKLLVPCPGSSISMYKNGKPHGVAYTDIYEGIYHPTISLYKGAGVTANFGPKFKYPPRDLQYEPMCKSSSKAIIERSVTEILYHIENEGKLLEFM